MRGIGVLGWRRLFLNRDFIVERVYLRIFFNTNNTKIFHKSTYEKCITLVPIGMVVVLKT